MTGDRGWILRTVLDPEATRGEVEAALRAARPAELEGIRAELDLTIWWREERLREIDGRRAHLAEQYPDLTH